MADVFLSYSRGERARAEVLASALESLGWSVFWDFRLPAGKAWEEFLISELEAARCVVVAWSAAAVQSVWVLEEAREGRDRKILVPVFFEEVKPPFGYRGIHGADLSTWEGDASSPVFRQLVEDLGHVLGAPPSPPARPAAKRPKRRKAAPKPKPKPERKRQAPSALKTGKGAPTWEEDEGLNRRILIEGGEFLMGSPGGVGEDRERPQHRVRLSSFYIQEHPVTNEEYRRFDQTHEFEKGRHPAVRVSWRRAMDYAAWLGGNLPTEAQWEFAARGSEGRTYPWGEEKPTLEHATFQSSGGTTPVASCPKGRTPKGVAHLAGNVWEWCRDWYGEYRAEDQVDPIGPKTGSARVLRGGSFHYQPKTLRGAYRNFTHSRGVGDSVGFRVVFPAAGELD